MSPDSASPTDVLYARAAAIRAVRGSEMNVFSEAVEALRDTAREANVAAAIVGGLAAIKFQVPVTTVDIDIVVARDGMQAFLKAAVRHGLTLKRESPDGWHLLEFSAGNETVGVEIVPEGGRTPRDPADAPPIPHPRELGVAQGLDYSSFDGWAAIKLVANRDKDRYHLVEALKHATPEQVAACVVRLRSLPQRYLIEFERLVKAAEAERT
jgi:hypothetical protein